MFLLFFSQFNTFYGQTYHLDVTPSRRIVNIVNFIRLLEPRDPAITEDVLYQTVVKQVALMRQYHLGGTFLLQYDALTDPRYYNDILFDLGYSDQAHFNKDFRKIVGASPGMYFSEMDPLAENFLHLI
ncbi:hypothetical protein BW716_26255 [[Flexibacter] sp. ATCC 35208]|nr:hypothetical protein BW716_26255 [[Flexibacter] sp. ATCC 35208]